MKTMKNIPVIRRFALAAVTGLVLLASCEDKVDFKKSDTTAVSQEATIDGYYSDTDDMALTIVSSDNAAVNGDASGRVIAKPALDTRFACDNTTITVTFEDDNTFQKPHGTITIDFGTGCTDLKGNTRTGILYVKFDGRRFMPGSTIITQSNGYSINGVALAGTRTVTNVSGSTEEAPKFNVVLDNGLATWSDQTSATREASLTYEWTRAANPLNDQLSVTGSASGTTRAKNTYTMEITAPLIYKRECALSARVYIAVQGTKEFTVDGKKLTIDYGAGDCDRKVTVTADNQSESVDVTGDI